MQLDSNNTTVNVNAPSVTRAFTNYMCKGTLCITKTVPEGSNDTVEGLTFQIIAKPDIESYVDQNKKTQYTDYNKTIVVGEQQSGVSFNIASDKKSVKIYISGLLYGTYLVTEINMPKIELEDGSQIDRYKSVAQTVRVEKPTSELTNLNIDNTWKSGTITIHKTAEEGVELDKFKFRVHGTSVYGTEVDTEIQVDEDGYGSAKVLVGEYTIEEIENKAFIAHYEVEENGNIVSKTEPQKYKVTEGKNEISVYNETAYGYVKIVKSLEGQTDASKSEGIKFQINGLAPSGENISETITIGNDGTGISGPIPAGGEYELIEDSTTVPEYYESIEPMVIDVEKDNTQENPLVLNLENKRGVGTLEISTETMPEGGPLFPIVYKVQEINIDEKTGIYEKIEGTEKTVKGDAQSFAKLVDIPAGMYVVEQQSVPKDWIKDFPQIVSVQTNRTEYAVFTIEQGVELQNTKVTIYKEILNTQDNIATEKDFEKYGLDKNESFEVKIVNIDTNKEYYTFIDSQNPGIVTGLPAGTYQIEEEFKPKYLTKSYNKIDAELENKIESEINESDGKYLFSIGTEEEHNNEVELKIVNKINTNFGFGGQDTRDNFSKITTQIIENAAKTRASFFIVDENGEFLPDCTFEIYNSDNKKIMKFTPKQKRLIISGLNVGTYTLKNISTPNGYILSDDIDFTVYDNAVRVVRVEILKNVPRGGLILETIYKTAEGADKNVANSKYKVVNYDTGELLRFTKRPDGSYIKSNLSNATDTISIRAGEVTINGLEEGTYDIGLVDVTNRYFLGDTNDVPKVVIKRDEHQDVDILVENKEIVDIEVGNRSTYVLDNKGSLWAWGYNDYGQIGNGTTGIVYNPICLNSKDNHFLPVKVKKVSAGYSSVGIVDVSGNIWIWGRSPFGTGNITTPKFIDVNAKFVDISVGYNHTVALDEYGKVWYAGQGKDSGIGISDSSYTTNFICLSDIENNPLADVKIKKIEAGDYLTFLIDELGRLWAFGNNNKGINTSHSESYNTICLSEKEGNAIYNSYISGTKIVDVSLFSGTSGGCILDENNRLYAWGTPFDSYITCISDIEAIKGKIITKIETGYSSTALIDKDGKIYVYGSSYDGSLGISGSSSTNTPVCINDLPNSSVKNIKFTSVALSYNHMVLLDNKGCLWGAGSSYYGEAGKKECLEDIANLNSEVSISRFEVSVPNYEKCYTYNMKFNKVVSGYSHTAAIDSEGRLWTWGSNYYNELGNSANRENNTIPKIVEFPENIKIKDVSTTQYGTLALDSKGRLWSWGKPYTGELGFGLTGGSYGYSKTCISETELSSTPLVSAYENGTKIEKIYSNEYISVAIDNFGKVWMCGDLSRLYKMQPNVMVCISDSVYNSKFSIEKVAFRGYTDNSEMAFLDSEGKVWIQNSEEFKCITDDETSVMGTEIKNNNLKIVDIGYMNYNLVLLDDLGRIWYKDSCISLDEENPLYEQYNNNNKIVTLSGWDNRDLLIDSNGHVWQWDYNSIPTCILNNKKFVYTSVGNSSYFAIDVDGGLWSWGDNEYGKLGNGTTLSVGSPNIITEALKNEVYNKKFNRVLYTPGNNTFFEADDGYVYSNRNNKMQAIRQAPKYLENNGITIKKEIENGSVVLDTNGKVWIIKNGEFVCETDIEGSELYNAYYNEGIKLIDIVTDNGFGGSGYLAIDNKGGLWAYGYTLYGHLGIGLEKTSVKNFMKVHFSEDINVSEITFFSDDNAIIKDTNGDYWISGHNEDGLIGNGTTDNADTFQKIVLDGTSKISEFMYIDFSNIYVKDNNDVIWAWGENNDRRTGESSSSCVTTPFCWNIAVDDFHVDIWKDYNEGWCGLAVALDKNGVIWTAGHGTYWTDMVGHSGSALGKVDNYIDMGIVKKICSSSGSSFAINEDGELWAWGANAYGNLGYATSLFQTYSTPYYMFSSVSKPVCLTNTLGNTFYQKKIKGIYDISCYCKNSYYGAGLVIVQDEDNKLYLVGDDRKYISTSTAYMYKDKNQQYPLPKELTDYNNKEIKEIYANDYMIFIKDEDNEVHVYSKGSGEKVDTSEVWDICGITPDMSVEEINNILSKSYCISNNTVYRFKTDYNYSSKKVTKYLITETNKLNMDNIKEITVTPECIFVIDENGNLYGKGNGSFLGINNTEQINYFINITNIENLSKPVFNKGWNIIYGSH